MAREHRFPSADSLRLPALRLSALRLSAVFRAAVLGLSLLALGACAGAPVNVSHMRRDSWSLDEARSLEMNFMRFDYQVMAVGRSAGLKGWAYVNTAKIPPWATWLDSVRLTAYLSDPDGNVLAQDSKSFLPRAVLADEGIPFEFVLSPEMWGQKPPSITFGYKLVLTEGRAEPQNSDKADRAATRDKPPFFASEDAITR